MVLAERFAWIILAFAWLRLVLPAKKHSAAIGDGLNMRLKRRFNATLKICLRLLAQRRLEAWKRTNLEAETAELKKSPYTLIRHHAMFEARRETLFRFDEFFGQKSTAHKGLLSLASRNI